MRVREDLHDRVKKAIRDNPDKYRSIQHYVELAVTEKLSREFRQLGRGE